MKKLWLTLSAWLVAVTAASTGLQAAEYEIGTSGTRMLESKTSKLAMKVLVEAANLGGGEVEIAEVYVPPNYQSAAHVHGIEIMYILEGELQHIVNGKTQILTPGMVAIVRAPDAVIHKVGDSGMRALIVWPGGGEIDLLAKQYTERPIEAPGSREDDR
jgi:quercetin dioxygenase-like cupin family protein